MPGFQPVSVDGIGSLNQLALAALAQWLTRDYANDPSAVPPIVAIAGAIAITQAPPTIPRNGQATVSVTGTAVQLSNQAVSGVIVQALAGNVNNVVIGDSAVTTANGFQLQPGQAAGVAIDNVSRLYINGAAGDGVCWIGS